VSRSRRRPPTSSCARSPTATILRPVRSRSISRAGSPRGT